MTTANDFTQAHDALLVAAFGSPELDEQAHLSAGMTPAQVETLRARIVKLRDAATDPEACAKVMVNYAATNADRSAWMLIFARFDDFVRQGKTPPTAFIEAINERLCVFRSIDSNSLDDAFFGKQGKGHPESTSITDYWWEETNASLVKFFLSRHQTTRTAKKMRGAKSPLDQAVDDTIALRKKMSNTNERGLSVTTIKRHYGRFNPKK
ncbi:MAG: hypothetical protein IPM03_17075 [Sulfuritalea sp.]|nr:hypothetical protein [Sulfuritalea sp.]